MALTKTQKQSIIKDLKDKLARQKLVIFADFTGLKVKDLSLLRKELKGSKNEIKISKKTLMDVAFKENKIEVAAKKLSGEIALIFGYQDQILPAKIAYQFSKNNPNFKILGGFMENQLKSAQDIIFLAQLPSREELLAKMLGSMSSPVSGFLNVLQGNIKGLVLALNAISNKK